MPSDRPQPVRPEPNQDTLEKAKRIIQLLDEREMDGALFLGSILQDYEDKLEKNLRLHHVMCDARDYGLERRQAAEGKLAKAREAWQHNTVMCMEPVCTYEGDRDGNPPEYEPCCKCWACVMSQALAKDDEELRLEELAEKAKREEENGGPEF